MYTCHFSALQAWSHHARGTSVETNGRRLIAHGWRGANSWRTASVLFISSHGGRIKRSQVLLPTTPAITSRFCAKEHISNRNTKNLDLILSSSPCSITRVAFILESTHEALLDLNVHHPAWSWWQRLTLHQSLLFGNLESRHLFNTELAKWQSVKTNTNVIIRQTLHQASDILR